MFGSYAVPIVVNVAGDYPEIILGSNPNLFELYVGTRSYSHNRQLFPIFDWSPESIGEIVRDQLICLTQDTCALWLPSSRETLESLVPGDDLRLLSNGEKLVPFETAKYVRTLNERLYTDERDKFMSPFQN